MNPSSPPKYDISSSQILSRQRPTSPSSSIASLPYRPNKNISNLFASTSSLPGSNFSSGSNTPTGLAGSVFSPGGSTQNGTFSPSAGGAAGHDASRSLVLQAFVPHVAVFASPDVDELLYQKGFHGTAPFVDLLRPFGERIQGRVTIRNSVGSSTTWDDYGIRFVSLASVQNAAAPVQSRRSLETSVANGRILEGMARSAAGPSKVGGDVPVIEELVDRHLEWGEMMGPGAPSPVDYMNHKSELDADTTPKMNAPPDATAPPLSPYYALYLRRLLSALPIAPHETFSHPVACCIVISSRNANPLGELKELYHSSNTGDDRLPVWIAPDFLRYYVLIHDEDRDDITKSQQVYEQMRRSFGLHCHLLRLRSSQCLPSDDDAVSVPKSEWSSAAEELAEIQSRELDENDDDHYAEHFIFESDTTALRTFIRELTAQSIIPSMERSTAHWNDQVASRRRGIGGRLMSLGKRFAFGSSSNSGSRTSSSPVSSTGSSGNYDALNGYYRPDVPESIMRRLADFAFMLRDFKLASSTYELVKSDYEGDKAWRYWAGANEMSAIAVLMDGNRALSRKSREEHVDKSLELAVGSWVNRSSAPFYALRTLMLAMELLKLRGTSAVDDAARWGGRIIEAGLVGDIGTALVQERIGACFAGKKGVASFHWGTRKRKAGLWTVLAADSFLRMGRTVQAEKCLAEARRLYGMEDEKTADALSEFEGMREFLDQLRQAIMAARLNSRRYSVNGASYVGDDLLEEDEKGEMVVEEVSESLDVRPHRQSLITGDGLDPLGVMEPLSPVKLRSEDPLDGIKNDGFS